MFQSQLSFESCHTLLHLFDLLLTCTMDFFVSACQLSVIMDSVNESTQGMIRIFVHSKMPSTLTLTRLA